MSAITSTQSGNWSAGSTWVGGSAPGNGDTAIIAGHNVTVDVATTVGTAGGSGTLAITVNGNNGTNGKLIVNSTLTLKGDVQLVGNAGDNW